MSLSPQVQAALIAVIGVALTLIVNRLLLEVTRRNERDAVITAVRSDIRSIVHAVHEIGLVSSFLMTFRSPADAPLYPPWVDSPRSEDYFQLFGAIAPQIGRIPPGLAKEVVRFYTYFRVARDAAAPLGLLKQSQAVDGQHIDHSRNVLFALSQSFQAAEIVLSAAYSPSGRTDDGVETAKALHKEIAETISAKLVDGVTFKAAE
ncbi:MAG: hypothetical protein ACREV3_07015 [Gammaproteobacteria bacterium]